MRLFVWNLKRNPEAEISISVQARAIPYQRPERMLP
jgi:hypothetical protein